MHRNTTNKKFDYIPHEIQSVKSNQDHVFTNTNIYTDTNTTNHNYNLITFH